MGRAIMDDPRWPWHVAAKLGEKIAVAPQYARSTPEHWPAYPMVHGPLPHQTEGQASHAKMGHATRE
jgi:hypothetical protein